MKSIYYLLLSLTVFMSGCVMLASDSALDKGKTSSLTHLYIVPIEGVPLMPSSLYGDNYQDFIQRDMDSLLNKNAIWEPSNEVSKKTKHYLETVGNYSITIAPDVEPLPGVESREVWGFMMNWLRPFNNWYDEDPSSIDYIEQPDFDTVMEVGVGINDFLGGHYRLQIVMKLVDATTRSVLANAQCEGLWPPRHFTELIPVVGFFTEPFFGNFDAESLFANNGSGFKELFRKTATIAVPECINALGLHRK